MDDLSIESELQERIDQLLEENKALRKELELHQGSFETYMDNSPATAFYKDAEGRLLYINKAFSDAFGFAERDWYGKTDAQLWDAKTAKVLRENDIRILNSGEPESVEEDVTQADGIHHWLTHKFSFYDSEGNQYLGGMGIDLTRQKQVDQDLRDALATAEKASQAKSEFLSLVSHELRTPLHTILSSAELWEQSDSVFNQDELVNSIIYGATRLRSQVENLVILAETDNDDLAAGTFTFDVRPLIYRIAGYADGLLSDTVTFDLSYDLSLPGRLSGDPYLIEQMIRTVLENACKYTELGHVKMHVSWADEPQQLEFRIEDTGCGISEDHQKKMYMDVVQTSRGLDRDSEGIGLGLTICYRLSELLNADLSITSKKTQGTTIEIAVPLTEVTNPLEVAHREIDESKQGTILIVEDNKVNALVLQRMVQHFGYRVSVVHTGEAALEDLGNNVYDLIFMDIQMPIMDGITTTRWIRQRGINTTIIAVSCNSEMPIRQRCMEVGMDDFMVKPVGADDVLRMLERQLSKAKD